MTKYSFQKKLILVYSLLISGLIIIISLIYSISIYSGRMEQVEKDLIYRSERMVSQLDTVISTMDFVSIDLISLWDFMPSLATLHYYDRDLAENQNAIMEARNYIEQPLFRYSLIRDFHRVSVYNAKGDFFTNNFGPEPNQAFKEQWVKDNPMLRMSDKKKGKIMVTAPYKDHWNRNVHPEVFAVLRAVVGQQKGEVLGYIEVQNPYSIIEDIFSIPENLNISVTIQTEDGEILYEKVAEQLSENDFLYEIQAPKSKVHVSLRESRKDGLSSLYSFIVLFTVVTLCILILSIIFIRFFTLQLTEPLEKLTRHIDTLDLGTLPQSVDLKSSHDEIESLNFAFTHLQKRLNESVQREIISHSLKIQANFDSLQAQVNPHFLFNVLNVISSMGLESNNTKICDVCDYIASMLRYSTSTLTRDSTIGQEIEHVRNYLLLQKLRYEHKLNYSFDVEKKVLEQNIPKIILQPLIENSIEYGFHSGIELLDIKISGGREKEGIWFLDIRDNGPGMEEKKLKTIRSEISDIKERISQHKEIIELNLGGLGVVNTYLRLYLYFEDRLNFIITNSKEGGLHIHISGGDSTI